ncbi:hypothetical protein CBM2587_B20100 [Cupriavidus taiwanensis]|uniref:Uncharacterized protein n=1 Tax=Cupriavidus taiwanensis TaxID=164546 RepID=A0A375C211_9BURK|nr:hypothetical protein CBM2587_B20100 [Cupriavidus taiwanensis]
MVAGSIGNWGHYSRAPCTPKFGFAKERLRGGLGATQVRLRCGLGAAYVRCKRCSGAARQCAQAGPDMRNARRTGRARCGARSASGG